MPDGSRTAESGIAAHDMPFGAHHRADGRTRFALYAPSLPRVDLVLEALDGNDGDAGARSLTMECDGGGDWHLIECEAPPGTFYRYELPGGQRVPDPAARRQHGGPHGYSVVVDPLAYRWQNEAWTGRPWAETVLLELHVGCFDSPGTFDAVRARLPEIAAAGFTALELMPVAAFAGTRGWGYDGVLPFAPFEPYGSPQDLKALVDAAHGSGLQIFLDVVYNHFGPDGDYLAQTAPEFFRDDIATPWGRAFDFRVPELRALFHHNALYWLEEYRFDGLRLDAVHAISSDARQGFLAELQQIVQAGVGRTRQVHLMVEHDDNDVHLIERGYAAQWNDDVHHALHVATSGETDGYYAAYADDPLAALGVALSEGFVFQGQHSDYHGRARGKPSSHLPPTRFVAFTQNHDQIGNRACGDRLTTVAGHDAARAARAIVMLSPQVPMLFMGEEWLTEAPFRFFTDFGGELGRAVDAGRRREFRRFAAFADEAAHIPAPEDPATFSSSILDWRERDDAGRAALAEFTIMTAVRRANLVPLLMADAAATTSVSRIGSHGLEIVWQFGPDGGWWLQACLGPEPVEGFTPAPQLLCYGSAPLDPLGPTLRPAWYVGAGRTDERGRIA